MGKGARNRATRRYARELADTDAFKDAKIRAKTVARYLRKKAKRERRNNTSKS